MINVVVLSSNNSEIIDCYGIEKCITLLNQNSSINAKKIDIENIHKLKNKDADVLIIAGGEPRQLRLHMKGSGAQAIRKFVSNGGGYIGICAGAVLAIPKAPSLELLQHVTTVNDNIWWNSGICGDINLKSCEIKTQISALDSICNKFDNTDLLSYKNGPLFAIKKSKINSTLIPLATFNGPIQNSYQSVSNNLSNEIDGSYAVIYGIYNKGSVIISSIHPEYGDDIKLLDDMCIAVCSYK